MSRKDGFGVLRNGFTTGSAGFCAGWLWTILYWIFRLALVTLHGDSAFIPSLILLREKMGITSDVTNILSQGIQEVDLQVSILN